MRLGFCTSYSMEWIEFARSAGFECLEIFVGGNLDPAKVKDADIKKARQVFSENSVAVSTVFHYENYAAKEAPARRRAAKNLYRTMDIAKGLGTNIVTLNAWVPVDVPLEEKLAFYKTTYTEFAKRATDKGVRLAIENCPHGFANISWNVSNWEKMFEAVPSKAIGLEYDPSHLLWQGIDYLRALRDFSDRVYAFHAKDTQILKHVLERDGMHGEAPWWRFRVPGYGDVDWQQLFVILSDIGYDGDMVIEHEDPVFDGDRRKEGLRLGLMHLSKFVV